MRGWLASVRRIGDVVKQVKPYDQLINLLRFDQNAARRFRNLRQQRIRIGTPNRSPVFATAQWA